MRWGLSSLCLLCAAVSLTVLDSNGGELCPARAGKANSVRNGESILCTATGMLSVFYQQLERTREEDSGCFSADCTTFTPSTDTRLSLTVRYSSPSGLFAEINSILVRKEAKSSPLSVIENISDGVLLLDAGLGYRLPRQKGIVRLEVLNVLDEEFPFMDEETRREENVLPPLPSDRAVAVRYSLNF